MNGFASPAGRPGYIAYPLDLNSLENPIPTERLINSKGRPEMTREQFMQFLEQTHRDAHALVAAKNQDYGADSDPFKNFKLISQLGVPVEIGILTRFADKVARIANLLQGRDPAVKSESLDDTLLDAINYLAILRAWLHRGRTRSDELIVRLGVNSQPVPRLEDMVTAEPEGNHGRLLKMLELVEASRAEERANQHREVRDNKAFLEMTSFMLKEFCSHSFEIEAVS